MFIEIEKDFHLNPLKIITIEKFKKHSGKFSVHIKYESNGSDEKGFKSISLEDETEADGLITRINVVANKALGILSKV
ncbi:hypothetical protein [uncultured Acinetobacter sp.]|uniref:hypothetical protein n=1 Tax=uncultured Acinetobacter sp. TaxID=165433 RepID=UPI00258F2DFC|nr:hypothetical protein [uncultured Acinetobacter sp.]